MDLLKRLDPRLPQRRDPLLRLGLRNLYILPTGLGWLWLAGIGLLMVVGVQTQANGPLFLAFLMLGLWLLALHLTHFNLQGLELRCARPSWGFADALVPYPLLVRSTALCEGLRLQWLDQAAEPHEVGVLRPGEHRLNLPWRPPARGLRCPGGLRLFSTAPLGLFICWTIWHPPQAQLIVPARRPGPVRELKGAVATEREVVAGQWLEASGDLWHDLRPKHPLDSPSRIAWKLAAQGRGALVKRFARAAPQALVLAPDPSLPNERALEHLSERLCQLHRQGMAYSLLWQGELVGPAEGLAHRDRCLRLLGEAP
jgi:uncharacterized protein (DUF58 family)